MGCAHSQQIQIYHKDDFPECINITFHFDKNLMTPDMHHNQIKSFDDNELLRPVQLFHIERLTIFYGKFITGIAVTYKLDGKLVTVEHLGSDHNNSTYEAN
jgi:hypothetical protein